MIDELTQRLPRLKMELKNSFDVVKDTGVVKSRFVSMDLASAGPTREDLFAAPPSLGNSALSVIGLAIADA